MNTEELYQTSVFKGLDRKHLDDILKIVHLKPVKSGEIIFEEDKDADGLYLIKSGLVDITKCIDHNRCKKITSFTAGDFFGEMALFDNKPRSATATAGKDTELYFIDRGAVSRLLESSPAAVSQLLLNIIRIISGRIRRTDTELVTLYETGVIIGSSQELSELFEKILGVVMRALRASKGIIMLYNSITDLADVKCYEGGYEKMAESFSAEEGLAGCVRQHGHPVIINSLKESPLYKDTPLQGYESETMLAVPLLIKNNAVGLIILGDKSEQAGGRFDLSDQNLLEAVAKQTSVAMTNAFFHQEALSKQRLGRKYYRF